MKRLTAFAFIIAAFLFVCGCGIPPVVPPEMGTVTGYVTDGQGGPAVAGATVTCQTYTTTTDAQGYFEIDIEANKISDLFVAKNGRASSKVQAIRAGEDETIRFSIPNRARFSPDWSVTPPVIEITGVNITNPISGTVTFNIDTTNSERMVNKIYAYFGGEQRAPRGATIFDSPIGDWTVDTALYPNGLTYLRILVYDDNDNTTLTYIPVTVNNTASETIPGALPSLGLTATSFGVNVGYYSARRAEMYQKYGLKGNPYAIELPNGGTFDLKSAPAGATVVVAVTWGATPNATSYRVLRSVDGTNYEQIGVVAGTSYNDYSPYVEANREIWYQVIPVNNAGAEGTGITRSVTPLPPYNVVIREPYDKSTNVPLQPKFTWEIDGTLEFPTGVEFSTVLRIFDVTSYIVFWSEQVDYTMVNLNGECQLTSDLEPAHTYSWDISESYVYKLYTNEANGFSRAISYAGEISDAGTSSGSINGEHMFTTISQ